MMSSTPARTAVDVILFHCLAVIFLHSGLFFTYKDLLAIFLGLMVVPHVHSVMAQSRSFACVGPSAWNCLPQSLFLELLALSPSQFWRYLKTFLLAGASCRYC